MTATQLVLDMTPIGAFAVGDRVRILPTCGATEALQPGWHPLVAAGEMCTVVAVRPSRGKFGSTCHPVVVLMDEPGDSGREREYAFEHEDLELVLDDAVAVDGRAA